MALLRRAGLAAILGALLLQPALAQTGADQLPEAEKERYRVLQLKFFCQCGCNYILLHCPHLVCPSAPVMRAEILKGMQTGLPDDEIVESMVASFGTVALSSPPSEGLHRIGWAMPIVALLGGLILLYGVARAWRRRAPVTIQPRSTALLDKHRSAVERELERLE